MIPKEELEEMFLNIRAKTDWDIDGKMLWGYFFADLDEENLKSFIPVLEHEGYRFVDLYIPEIDECEEVFYFLHVEREESHTPESLYERNQQLTALAERNNIDDYDGMDVGPIGSKL